eukprot:5591028-Amphidinium_carterae.4
MSESGNGSFLNISCDAQMITHGRAWNLIRPAITPECLGLNPYHSRNGKDGVGEILISVTIKTVALEEGMSHAASAHGKAAVTSLLEGAAAADTGRVKNTR